MAGPSSLDTGSVEHNLPYGDYVSYPPVMPLA
ncbi:Uncharacterised protein [Bordetella pertussis]|nr:Uncharacterised protein [Bordetella pertussis]